MKKTILFFAFLLSLLSNFNFNQSSNSNTLNLNKKLYMQTNEISQTTEKN